MFGKLRRPFKSLIHAEISRYMNNVCRRISSFEYRFYDLINLREPWPIKESLISVQKRRIKIEKRVDISGVNDFIKLGMFVWQDGLFVTTAEGAAVE